VPRKGAGPRITPIRAFAVDEDDDLPRGGGAGGHGVNVLTRQALRSLYRRGPGRNRAEASGGRVSAARERGAYFA
jgi:hypothetical protein